jgi:hypothetical protein
VPPEATASEASSDAARSASPGEAAQAGRVLTGDPAHGEPTLPAEGEGAEAGGGEPEGEGAPEAAAPDRPRRLRRTARPRGDGEDSPPGKEDAAAEETGDDGAEALRAAAREDPGR